MPLPGFTNEGVLPPFVGSNGPGGSSEDMSPYVVTALEVAVTLGTSDNRRSILRNWLAFREELRRAGFERGFQWLDGSFVENKEPRDLDVVNFLFRPASVLTSEDLENLIKSNLPLFDRVMVRATYNLDSFAIDLNGSPARLVDFTRYFCGLFSHRRGDGIWKGLLQVPLEDVSDANAIAFLGAQAQVRSGAAS